MLYNNTDAYAMVTGASQGLGKAISFELAKRGKNIILISLPNQNIDAVAAEIASRHSVKTVYYETDFSRPGNVLTLSNWINKNYNIDMLINNAGTGGTKTFINASVEYINDIMNVNMVATSILVHQLLPGLMRQSQSYILNISSIAAYMPVGYKTVYPASKAFVYALSRGLAEELKSTSVFVSVATPGAMKTNKEITARIEKQGLWGKLIASTPESVAKHCINGMLKKNKVISLNSWGRMALRLLPASFLLPHITSSIKNEMED